MSISSDLTRLQTAKSDIAAQIFAKGITVPEGTKIDGFAPLIAAITTDLPTVLRKAVNFYDYNGILVASYTIAEAAALSDLPNAPDHSADEIPMTFQSWTETLSTVKATTMPMDVGAMYITTDGKTHAKLRLTAVSGYAVPIYFNKSDTSTLILELRNSAGTLVWSTTSAMAGNQSKTVSGVSTPDDYDLIMWISSGSGTYGFGNGSNITTFIGGNVAVYMQALLEVRIGLGVTGIGAYAFNKCDSLTSVVLPLGVTGIDMLAFFTNTSLTSMIIPSGVTVIGPAAFSTDCSLTIVIIPSSVTDILGSAFEFDYSLTSIVIPSSVTYLEEFCFSDCRSIKEYIVKPATAPVFDETVLSGIASCCRIKVPAASLTAYQSAPGWSTYASYMDGI